MKFEVLDTIRQVSANTNNYKQWQNSIDNYESRRQEYYKTLELPQDKLDKAQNYGKAVINAVNVMDIYSEDKAEDIENASEMAKTILMELGMLAVMAPILYLTLTKPQVLQPLFKPFSKLEKWVDKVTGQNIFKMSNYSGQMLGTQILQLGSMLATMAPVLILGNYFQKKGSRIARFQAREQILKDPRNFVTYDQDQIEEAKNLASQMSDPVEPKGFKKLFARKKSTSEKYYGKKDGTLATIKSVAKDWKEYEKWRKEDQQTRQAKDQSFAGTNLSSEKLEEAKAHQQIITDITRKIDIKAQNYSENSETLGAFSLTAMGTGGVLAYKLSSMILKGLTKIGLNIPAKVTQFAPAVAAIGMALPIISFFTSFQKDMARLGRFKAKQELLNDPKNFVYIDEKELEDIQVPKKEPQGVIARIKNKFNSVRQLFKDYKEFKKYEKDELPEEIKLQKALRKVALKPGQLEQAESLQKKVFNTFEVLDDNSQRYAEDIELTNEMAGMIFTPIVSFGSGLLTYLAANKLFNIGLKGKIAAGMVGLLGSSFAMEAYFTKMQKKASKIGVMKAIQELQNPQNYADNSAQPANVVFAKEMNISKELQPASQSQPNIIYNWLKQIS